LAPNRVQQKIFVIMEMKTAVKYREGNPYEQQRESSLLKLKLYRNQSSKLIFLFKCICVTHSCKCSNLVTFLEHYLVLVLANI
jgi:hypothetical protein